MHPTLLATALWARRMILALFYCLEVSSQIAIPSYSTITRADVETERRMKNVELWLGASLADLWEMR
jgi:hypothetical protein